MRGVGGSNALPLPAVCYSDFYPHVVRLTAIRTHPKDLRGEALFVPVSGEE